MSLFNRRKEGGPSDDINRIPKKSLPPFIRAAIDIPPDRGSTSDKDTFNATNTTDSETPHDLTPRVDAQDLTFSELLDKINQAQRDSLEKADKKKIGKDRRRIGLRGLVERMSKKVKMQQIAQSDTDESVQAALGEQDVIFISDTHPRIKLYSINSAILEKGDGNKTSQPFERGRLGRYNFRRKAG